MTIHTFGSFTYDKVEKTFNIQKIKEHSLLYEWINTSLIKNDYTEKFLLRIKEGVEETISYWNEDELMMFFIGPILSLANMYVKDIQPFVKRTLTSILNKKKIEGTVDFIMSKGKKAEKQPYVFIQRWKSASIDNSLEENEGGEPLGQLLIAMLAAQTLNENKFPILGAYIVGRNWFFVVLEDKQYAVSAAYDAASEDIFQIFAILQKSKEIIQRFI